MLHGDKSQLKVAFFRKLFGAVRALLFRCKKKKKGNWQALTGAGLLDLLFGLLNKA
jgi:hypothetical protein